MALKSTVYRIQLQLADMDRHVYGDHSLTLARHPSENDERLMVRVLAFALYAEEGLAFANGLAEPDEADLWKRDLTGAIDLWIDVGLPDERLIRKAAGRARRVVVLAYGRTAEAWWQQNRGALERLDKLEVRLLAPEESQALAELAARGMQVQCTIQDGQVWMGDGERSVSLEPRTLKTVR